LEKEVKEEIFRLGLKNIELISRWLSGDEIRQLMLECHISLGQLENHDRLKRTIPHKAFETLALGIPYITARAEGISEILTDGESCLMVNPADPEDLADKILQLKNNPKLADRMTKNGLELFKNKFNTKTLAYEIMSIYENI
jgi:glycosyltransferase involved in cell wall biosynthesis